MQDQQHAILEVIADTVEEAIQKGLEDLALPKEDVEIEILDRGNKGLFGLGSRQARVRLKVKGALAEQSETRTLVVEEGKDNSLDFLEDDEVDDGETVTEGDERVLGVAEGTMRGLLERMKVKADVKVSIQSSEDNDKRKVVWIDVTGKDLSVLIGRRAQTLQALQYIAALIVGKELGQHVPLVVDVEGFRSRRQNQLKRLANSMAEQAVKTGRRQVLEPMPANERRVIHIELRSHPQVFTESTGEEPNRKVTIIPKE